MIINRFENMHRHYSVTAKFLILIKVIRNAFIISGISPEQKFEWVKLKQTKMTNHHCDL